MKLLQLKIRGLGSTIETNWIDINHQLTQLVFSEITDGIHLLRALETINPCYACQLLAPFKSFPVDILHHGHHRRLSPGKRTISMSVFGAPPKLIHELAEISDLLYETDRIEVGRRLDYSRWLNFVELASSTRWSEVMREFSELQKYVATFDSDIAAKLTIFTSNLEPSTRVKGDLMHQLNDWLNRVNSVPDENLLKEKAALQIKILRALHFQDARTLILDRLPLYVHINETSVQTLLDYISKKIADAALLQPTATNTIISLINEELERIDNESGMKVLETKGDINITLVKAGSNFTPPFPSMDIEILQTIISLCRAVSKILFKTEPILLFTMPSMSANLPNKTKIKELITKTAESCQCVCVTEEVHTFTKTISCSTHIATDFSR